MAKIRVDRTWGRAGGVSHEDASAKACGRGAGGDKPQGTSLVFFPPGGP